MLSGDYSELIRQIANSKPGQMVLPFGPDLLPGARVKAAQQAVWGSGETPMMSSRIRLAMAQRAALGQSRLAALGGPRAALGAGSPAGGLEPVTVRRAAQQAALGDVPMGGSIGEAFSPLQQAAQQNAAANAASAAETGTASMAAASSDAAKAGRFAKLFPGGIGGAFAPSVTAAEGATGLAALGGPAEIAGRLAIPIGGAYLASGVGHAAGLGTHDGNWDEGAEGGLTGLVGGALAGATIGAPVFGVGAVPGAVVGGALGLLGGTGIGLFGPKNTGEKAVASELKAQTGKLTKALSEYGLSDDTKNQLVAQLKLNTLNANSKKEVKAAAKELLSGDSMGQILAADQANRRQQERIAAVQAWMGPTMQQALDSTSFYTNAQADAFDRLAAQYSDPQQAAVTRAYGANARVANAQAQQAMLQQIMLAPALYGYSTATNSDGTQATDLQSILNAQPSGAGG